MTLQPSFVVYDARLEYGDDGDFKPLGLFLDTEAAKKACEEEAGEQLGWEVSPDNPHDVLAFIPFDEDDDEWARCFYIEEREVY